jgi:hypothetical protein
MFKKHKKTITLAIIFSLILGFNFFLKKNIVDASSLEDPLTTLSYVEMRLEEIEEKILQKVRDILADLDWDDVSKPDNQPTEPEQPETPEEPPEIKEEIIWQVIVLEKDERLVAEAGCEIILRSGEAYAIASALGGVADLTAGSDLGTGQSIALNHHLLIPRSDGRGLKAEEMSYLMIKGQYTIE